MPKVYDPDVIELAKKCQDPAKEIWGFGQTLNRCDDGNGFMQNILWDYGGGTWDKDGKPALATTYLKQNLAAIQFAVDSIQKHKVQPPGVMSWTDVSNNEAYMAGKLVCTNNGASLYYAMGAKKHPLYEKTQVLLTPGGPAGSFVASNPYCWGIFKATKNAELAEDLIRYLEDEKHFEEYMTVCAGQAGPVYRAARYRTGKPIPTTRACCRTSCAAYGSAIRARSRRRPSRCRPSTSSVTWRVASWSAG